MRIASTPSELDSPPLFPDTLSADLNWNPLLDKVDVNSMSTVLMSPEIDWFNDSTTYLPTAELEPRAVFKLINVCACKVSTPKMMLTASSSFVVRGRVIFHSSGEPGS